MAKKSVADESHKLLKSILSERKLTFTDIAASINESYHTMMKASRVMSGTSERSSEIRKKIADYLGIDPATIWPQSYLDGVPLPRKRAQKALGPMGEEPLPVIRARQVKQLLHERGYSVFMLCKEHNLVYSSMLVAAQGLGNQSEYRDLIANVVGKLPADIWPELFTRAPIADFLGPYEPADISDDMLEAGLDLLQDLPDALYEEYHEYVKAVIKVEAPADFELMAAFEVSGPLGERPTTAPDMAEMPREDNVSKSRSASEPQPGSVVDDISARRKRHDWIRRELRERGVTFRDIAEETGASNSEVFYTSLGDRCNRQIQCCIADHLGSVPENLWPETFGEVDEEKHKRIATELRRLGISFKHLAEELGCSTSVVVKVSRGERRNLEIERVIASRIGVKEKDLWPKKLTRANSRRN